MKRLGGALRDGEFARILCNFDSFGMWAENKGVDLTYRNTDKERKGTVLASLELT